MTPPTIWSHPGVDADLRARWAMNAILMPCRRIAEELSAIWGHRFTASAVIGRAHRIKLGLRWGRTHTAKPRQSRKPKPPPPEPPPPPRLVPRRSECCFPVGHPGEPGFHYCGAPSLPHKSYCAEHYERTHVGAAAAAVAAAIAA